MPATRRKSFGDQGGTDKQQQMGQNLAESSPQTSAPKPSNPIDNNNTLSSNIEDETSLLFDNLDKCVQTMKSADKCTSRGKSSIYHILPETLDDLELGLSKLRAHYNLKNSNLLTGLENLPATLATLTNAVANISKFAQESVNERALHVDSSEPHVGNRALYSSILKSQAPYKAHAADETKLSLDERSALSITLCQPKNMPPVLSDLKIDTHLSIKSRVDRAIASLKIQRADNTPITIKAIFKHSKSKDIVLIFMEKNDKLLVEKDISRLIPLINPGLIYKPQVFPVIVHRVPTSFDTNNPEKVEQFVGDNDLRSFSKVVWATSPESRREKAFSSLIIHLTSALEANHAVTHGLSYQGRLLPDVHKSIRPLVQCFNCSHFGHTAGRCRSPKPLCGKCAGIHALKDCICTSATDPKCADSMSCTHIVKKCALCGGNHEAVDRHSDCVARLQATKSHFEENHPGYLYPTNTIPTI